MRRTRLIAAALVLLCGLGVAGCSLFGEPTTDSPFHPGTKVTAAQLMAEQQAATSATQAAAAKEAADLARTQRDTADRLAAEDRQRQVDFRSAVAKLDAESRLEIDRLTAQYQADAATTASSLERMASGAKAAADELATRTTASIATLKAQGDAGLAAIQAKQDQLANVFNFAQGAAGVVPGYGTIAAAGIGILGALFGVHKLGAAQKAAELTPQIAAAADKGFDDGHAVATAAAAQRDQHYDLGQAAATQSLALLSAFGVKLPGPLTPGAGAQGSGGQGSVQAAAAGTVAAAA